MKALSASRPPHRRTTDGSSTADRAPALGIALPPRLPLRFTLDAGHEAHEPPEARGVARDGVRLMVSRGVDRPVHTSFARLAARLEPADLLVVNTSGTVPAALDARLPDGRPIVVHLSTELPGGIWMIEPRQPITGGASHPLTLSGPTAVTFTDGRSFDLVAPAPSSRRLWLAIPRDGVLPLEVAHQLGRPIRYGYVLRDWPLSDYQSVFSIEPGSAEMPSAARPFTPAVVDSLHQRGIKIAGVTLHTGVASLEGHELPYPERYRVARATADAVNSAHDAGRRVIAVGTTVVRALESAVDDGGRVHAAGGWTDTVVTPARGVRAVDGLLTGWHEPEATHLAMLEAVAGRDALLLAYDEAFRAGYRWHEFGDSHLLLPYARRP